MVELCIFACCEGFYLGYGEQCRVHGADVDIQDGWERMDSIQAECRSISWPGMSFCCKNRTKILQHFVKILTFSKKSCQTKNFVVKNLFSINAKLCNIGYHSIRLDVENTNMWSKRQILRHFLRSKNYLFIYLRFCSSAGYTL